MCFFCGCIFSIGVFVSYDMPNIWEFLLYNMTKTHPYKTTLQNKLPKWQSTLGVILPFVLLLGTRHNNFIQWYKLFWIPIYFGECINYYLRLTIRVVCREFLTPWVNLLIYQISLKRTLQTGFWVQNHLLNLHTCVVNLQRLFCSQKAGVKCSY